MKSLPIPIGSMGFVRRSQKETGIATRKAHDLASAIVKSANSGVNSAKNP